ncbi:taste receptor type 2 member 7-like [Monodelphis domestica]|uniref:taste receptor type 2 member 7-like n=1 Tax=Monodelphis domestica TaxID=13616 RepID=UPI0024E2372A|nr:taste receptor type 2 member 7-like [Monodelphis domestica]
MLDVPENICLIVLAGETIMGTLINVFIGLVNCIDWVKSRTISLVDFIFLSLAFSRICLLLIMLASGMLGLLYRDIYETRETLLILSHLWIIASYSNISFVTCLSVFYFLKIAHFSHPLFFWLKWRMNKVVLMILLGSLLMFLFMSLLLRKEFTDKFIKSTERKEEKNHTEFFQMRKTHFKVMHNLFYLGPLILLSISLISCVLLVLSLWRHTWQMHLNATGSRDPSTEAHRRVIIWMLSFLFLLILYYVGVFTSISASSMLEKRMVEVLGVVIAGVYPSGHSFILILGNSKLRQSFLWVWRQALLRLRGGKP